MKKVGTGATVAVFFGDVSSADDGTVIKLPSLKLKLIIDSMSGNDAKKASKQLDRAKVKLNRSIICWILPSNLRHFRERDAPRLRSGHRQHARQEIERKDIVVDCK